MVVRRLAFGLVVALLLPVAAVILLLGSGDRRIAALQQLVALTTPYSLSLQDARLSLRPLRLEAELLQLGYPQANTPPLLSIQQLDVTLPLGRLLGRATDGGRFSARNVSYFLDETASDTPLDLEGLIGPLAWLPARVDVGSVHLVSRAENVWVFPLLNVSGQRTDSDAMAVITEADIGRRRVVLEALVAWRVADTEGRGLDVDAAMYGPRDDSRLELHGRIEADGADLRYATTLTGVYTRISDFITALEPGAYSFEGNLHIDGELHGDLDGYELRIGDLSITMADSYVVTATGRVARSGSGPAELRIEARGEATQVADLLPLPAAVAALLERSEGRLGLGGTLDAPIIERAAIDLYGPGAARVTLENPALDLPLDALRDVAAIDTAQLAARVEVGDLPALLAAAGKPPAPGLPRSVTLLGELRAVGSDIRASFDSVRLEAAQYRADGRFDVLWQKDTLSLPALALTLTSDTREGRIAASGSVGDLLAVHGVVLDVTLEGVDPDLAFDVAAAPSILPGAGLRVDGRLRLLKAAAPIWLRDIDATLSSPGGLGLHARGSLRPDPLAPEADIELELAATDASSWRALGLPLGPDEAHANLRLRPRYATVLGSWRRGATSLQTVANADLRDGAIAGLGLDVYGPDIRLEDFAVLDGPSLLTGTAATADGASSSAGALGTFPVHLTVRSDRLRSAHAGLDNLSIRVRGDKGRFLLEQFDSRYAGGELVLRGVADLSISPPAFSVAGQGVRVPLAALTRDLGLQESVTGALSLRGGLSTRGDDLAGIVRGLTGRIALAVSDTQVSGPAYDLLMTNLLAWLVQGSSQKTTTFDCSMAQFDIEEGVAQTDSLYIETPRMLATGKGRIDLNAATLDLRIEPRSKSRSFQFPSAVRLRGPLADPSVSVSELQATADLSAQALLLLPSLTLKLFGVGVDDDAPRPCTPSPAPAS